MGFIEIWINTPIGSLVETEKLVLKYSCKCKGNKITKIILNKNKVKGLRLPEVKIYYKARVIKIVLCLCKNNTEMNVIQ